VVLAALLVLAGTAELLRRRLPLPRTPTWRLAGGALSGAFGGLVGNQGGIQYPTDPAAEPWPPMQAGTGL